MLSKTEKISKIKQWLNQTKLDPAIVKQTIGVDSAQINPAVLLAASEKLVRINQKKAEPDDRDHLKFSKFLGIEDFAEEHVARDAGRVQQKAAYKMQARKNLSWLTPGFFSPQIRNVIIGNSLAQNVDGINPMEHWDNSHRITKMGPGGIPCHDDQTEVLTDKGFVFWKELTGEEKLACWVEGSMEYHKPDNLYAQHYDGTLYGVRTERVDYLVTPNHKFYCAHEIYNRHTKVRRWSGYMLETAEAIHKKRRKHVVAFPCEENISPIDFNAVVDVGGYKLPLVANKKHAMVIKQHKEDQFYTVNYNGYVYCAEVPGHLLFTRRNGKTMWSGNSTDAIPPESRNVSPSSFGFFDPVHVMETEKIGITNFANHNVGKGKDGKLWRIMRVKGKLKWMDHEDILNHQVKIPEF